MKTAIKIASHIQTVKQPSREINANILFFRIIEMFSRLTGFKYPAGS
ncbi:hypothetical protein KXD93_22015 [Mucilaginibacter sp. BJC16-A38]|nr:hypothetical protein [Mucilaginibacter phenanthrenivorans]MCR8560345.1 hypothetical protein [Mucilaginibacter phenanthrenivorans]